MEVAFLVVCLILLAINLCSMFLIGGRVWKLERSGDVYHAYLYKDLKAPVPIAGWLYQTSLWSQRVLNVIVLFFFAMLLLNAVKGTS